MTPSKIRIFTCFSHMRGASLGLRRLAIDVTCPNGALMNLLITPYYERCRERDSVYSAYLIDDALKDELYVFWSHRPDATTVDIRLRHLR